MTVRTRAYKGRKGQWEVDIRFNDPDGNEVRQRVRAPVGSRTGAQKWGEEREKALLLRSYNKRGEDRSVREVPTLEAFWLRFEQEHVKAERHKPSTQRSTEQRFETHLRPLFGQVPLNKINNECVQKLKATMSKAAPKTVNNVLSTLSVMLNKAVEWGVLDALPCQIRLLKQTFHERDFYDFQTYDRMVSAAGRVGHVEKIIILLGGEAGLRMGEILALRWTALDFERGMLKVRESDWRGTVTSPKSGRTREVKMTDELSRALRAHKHLRGERVLTQEDGQPFTERMIRRRIEAVERRAEMEVTGRIHVLRHTFCSHLAMEGAAAKAIQELAGHANLTTTMRYMHLSPSARDEAVALLNRRRSNKGDGSTRGDILEMRPGK